MATVAVRAKEAGLWKSITKIGLVRALFIASTMFCGCSNEDGLSPNGVATSRTQLSRPSEDPLVAISTALPAFAGYYCEAGDLVVLTVGSATEASIHQVIGPETIGLCYDSNYPHEPGLVAHEARYEFSKLRQWRDSIVDRFFDLDGALTLGIDYKLNQIRVKARASSDAFTKVNSLASDLAIPNDALVVEPGMNVVATSLCNTSPTDVNSCFHPVPAGVVTRSTQSGTPQGLCSIASASSRWNGSIWEDGWLTAGHCVPPQNQMLTDSLYQPDVPQDNSNRIGIESVDPAGWTCGSQQCRYSDAAWVRSFPSNQWQVPQKGKIARPSYWGNTTLDSNPNLQRFAIRDYKYSIQGMQVHKVGRTSGWGYGYVSAACIDTDGVGNFRLICQDEANYTNLGGDSGAPVFFWRWGGVWEVIDVDILGINWGTDGSASVYSEWPGVISDLGLINGNDPCPTNAKTTTTIHDASSEYPGYPAIYAIDGSTSTRWSSNFSDPQWISVDLGSVKSVARVRLNWETAYGLVYKIQASNDAFSWQDLVTVTSGDGGIDDWNIYASTRYIRMYGTARGTSWGYSLWEFEVYTCQ